MEIKRILVDVLLHKQAECEGNLQIHDSYCCFQLQSELSITGCQQVIL